MVHCTNEDEAEGGTHFRRASEWSSVRLRPRFEGHVGRPGYFGYVGRKKYLIGQSHNEISLRNLIVFV